MKAMLINDQKLKFAEIMSRVVIQNKELLDSDKVDVANKERLELLRFGKADNTILENSLNLLTYCLKEHYGKKAIILIDEYDVPLQSAFIHNYYDEMTMFLGNIFSSALKTNNALERGVLTGCLQIAKESIFTGLNNFTVRSITSQYGGECFGLTQNEIN